MQRPPVLAEEGEARQVELVEQGRPQPLDHAGVGDVGPVGGLVRPPEADQVGGDAAHARLDEDRDHVPVEVAPRGLAVEEQGDGPVGRPLVEVVDPQGLVAVPARAPPRSAGRTGSPAGRRTARRACAGAPSRATLTIDTTKCQLLASEPWNQSGSRGSAGRIERLVDDSEAWWPEPARPPDLPGRDPGPQRGRGPARRHRLRPLRLLRLRRSRPRTSTGWPPAGCRYTNFHVTPLCSPTRACLLTGRNHHTRRHAGHLELRTPASRTCGAHITPHAATVGRGAAATTATPPSPSASGTWPRWTSARPPGPFDQWPLQRGFDRFYGFLDGETDQFHPELDLRQPPDRPAGLARGRLPPQRGPGRPRHRVRLTTARSSGPTGPFFTYLAFGATHAPHQAPPEYLAKYRGRVRRRAGTSPASSGSPASSSWASCPRAPSWRPATRRRAVGRAARQPAGASPAGCRRRSPPSSTTPTPRSAASSTTSRRIGELDNTIFVVLSDNGASQEGGPFGVHARDEVLQRHPRDAGRGGRAPRRHRRARTATPTTRGAGPRPATPRSSGTSRTPTRAAST